MVGCKFCGLNSSLESVSERGEVVCTSCGAVCSESGIVTEVSFDRDRDGGGPLVFGQLVSADGLTGYERHKLGKSSVGLARKRLLCLGAKLRLSSSSVEIGFSFYKLSLSQGLLRGYRNKVADAVLLYITCRLEGTPHMLVDFSDILRVHLVTLGRLFLKLSKGLHLTLPLGDPWQYILRFSSRLSLGDKRHEVATRALRLVARMKRDWMNVGRHPCGLYGAALFVAARVCGFMIHVREISQVVGLHQSTVKKRLSEFERTPSGALTIEEFFRIDLKTEEEPPAFKRARYRASSESDSDSEEDSALSVRRPALSVDQTIARARYLQKLKEVGPPPSEPSSQSEFERFSSYENSVETSDEQTSIVSDGELDLTGLDECELENYILSKEEAEKKTELWTSEFGEFEEGRLLRAEIRKNRTSKPPNCVKKRALEVPVGPDSSTREALQLVIDKTGLQEHLSIGALMGDGEKADVSENGIHVDGTATRNGYESEGSDSNKSDNPMEESLYSRDVVEEQDMYFEDYDIR